jgi:hypothetical protein
MRDDFTKKTKEILAKRAGFLCSNPSCRKLTVGSNEIKDKTTNIGVAAHIAAASPGGKRYDNKMTPDERKSIDNGIWLCHSCSVLIDRDEKKYTVEILKSWKKQAEDFTSKKLEGIDIADKPFLEADLIWSHCSRINNGLSSKNLELSQPIIAGTPLYIHWNLNWDYIFEIYNNSEVPAYNIELLEISEKKFTYIERPPKINNIPPFQSIKVKIKYHRYFHGTHKEADKILSPLIPDELNGLELYIKYLDRTRSENITRFYIKNGEFRNEKIK